MTRLATACFVLAGAAAAVAEPVPLPTDRPGSPVTITAEPIEIRGGDLNGVRLVAAWELTAPADEFGGFSGVLVRGGRLLAVSDRAAWLVADYAPEPGGAGFSAARLLPVAEGQAVLRAGGDGADSEALALTCDGLALSFEREHRIVRYAAEGGATRTVRPDAFSVLPFNGGIEALATMPHDCSLLLAIGEDQLEGLGVDGGHPVFLFRAGEVQPVARTTLPPIGPHGVTGAAFGPDGRLYVLFRHFSPLSGTNVRLRRYTVSANLKLEIDRGESLAEWAPDSGIDNMEAIALWTDVGGRVRLTLMSDDNFNPIQRTILLDLVLED